ncbi:MAG: tetratricopeptide repeat protein, partial [Deltaproteobacteria bacterium]|nr:tetratricopeptide repeat protein [Deltaproteobacteria bacterium]
PFGGADLPTPSDDPFGGADLPTPSDDPFGATEMPSSADFSTDSTILGHRAPVIGDNEDDPFGGNDLSPSLNDSFDNEDPFGETPHDSSPEDPFGGVEMPSPADFSSHSTLLGHDGFHSEDDDFNIPSPADIATQNSTIVSPGGPSNSVFPPINSNDASRGSGADFGNIDFSSDSDDNNDGFSGENSGFGQVSLSGGSEDSGEFDAFPVQEEGDDESRASSGDSLDLAEDIPNRSEGIPSDIFNMGEDKKDEADADAKSKLKKVDGSFGGRRKYERQSRKTRLVMLGLLTIVSVGGGMLYFTPYGVFGVNLLIRLLPDATSDKAVVQYFSSAIKALDKDTVSSLNENIKEIETLGAEKSNNEDIRLIGIYLHNWYQLRFGISKEHEREAVRLLGNINLSESESKYASIAKLSRELVMGHIKVVINQLSAKPNLSSNEMALLAMAYINNNNSKDALKIIKTALKTNKTARFQYLEVLALVTGYKNGEAIKKLEILTQSAPNHWDAKLVFANLLVDAREKNVEKITALLTPVNEASAGMSTKEQKAEVHSILAKLLLQNRKYDNAKKELVKAEELNSKDLIMLTVKGDIAIMSGDIPGAMSAFRNALAQSSSDISAQLGMASTYLLQEKVKESKEIVDRILQILPENYKANYLSGKIALAGSKYDQAEEFFKKSIKYNNEFVESYVELAGIYMKQEKQKEAMDILDAASEAVPDSCVIKLTLAEGHAANGDYSSAIVVLNEAQELEPDNPVVFFKMAQMYRKMESLEDAQNALDEVVRLDPEYPGLSVEQGYLLELSGKIGDALSTYEKALEKNPDDLTAKTRVAAASLYQKKFDRSKELLVDVLNENPDSPDGNFYMGEIFRQEYNGTDAIPYLKTACDLDEHNPIYHVRLGAAYDLVHDSKKAMVEYNKALELDPKMAETFIRIGKSLLTGGAARDSIVQFEKGLVIEENLENANLYIGEAYEELSDLQSAAKYYKKEVDLFNENAEAFYKLGMAYLQLKGNNGAIAPLKRAVTLGAELDPKPIWLSDAYYLLGTALKSVKDKQGAIKYFKEYLKVAPEGALDRSEVEAYLDELLY